MSAALESGINEAAVAFARAVLDIVKQHAQAAQPSPDEWIDQYRSPLGHRAHLRAVREKRLPGYRRGNLVLVRRADLDRFIEGHPVGPNLAPAPDTGDPDRRKGRGQ